MRSFIFLKYERLTTFLDSTRIFLWQSCYCLKNLVVTVSFGIEHKVMARFVFNVGFLPKQKTRFPSWTCIDSGNKLLLDHLLCNHFSRKVTKSGFRKVVLQTQIFFFWSTTFLEPDFTNQISKNCKN